MRKRLADDSVSKICELGQAFDIGRLPVVFDGGRVGFVETSDQEDLNYEPQGTRGSPAGSRQGAEAGSRWTPGEAARDGVFSIEAAYLSGIDELKAAYPVFVKHVTGGMWVVAKSLPLGPDGPQVHFVIAVPFKEGTVPRAWAFWTIGPTPKFVGPRHTNFPDASICAYGNEDGAWEPADGLRALVDLYSTWAVRQLYFENFGRWPGRQHGLSALYRRKEFHPDEWCGCDNGRRYKDCHMLGDLLMSEDAARIDHLKVMGSEYCNRRPPKSVIDFVRSGWKKAPELAAA